MKLLKIFFILLFFLSFKINANNLINHLNKFFKKEYSFNKNNFSIHILTPLKKYEYCQKPYFLLANYYNHYGLFDVLYICKKHNQYLTIQLRTKGKYIVARRKITRGTKISETDIKTVIGRLDNLPCGVYLNKKDVVNKVNIRDIFPFQPITSFMMRLDWIIKAHQEVTIIFRGMNFEIITIGKALSNGSFQDVIRVQVNNNKIIKGIVNQHGEVIMIL